MRGLCRGVDNYVKDMTLENLFHFFVVANIHGIMLVFRMFFFQKLSVPLSARASTEKVTAHVIVNADYREAFVGEKSYRFRTDETGGSGNQNFFCSIIRHIFVYIATFGIDDKLFLQGCGRRRIVLGFWPNLGSMPAGPPGKEES